MPAQPPAGLFHFHYFCARPKSCFLCLCEGLPNEGSALRHKYFVESRNSLAETVGAIDLAAAIGAMRQTDADAIQMLGLRVRRMLTALLR
jgi:hypothetical protein